MDVIVKIAFDFGTKFAAAAYALVEPRGSIDIGEYPTNDLHSITFPSSKHGIHQVRTQLAWFKGDGRFLWGHEVDNAIDQRDITASDRIDLLKLALDNRDETTEQERMRIKTRLDRLANECGNISIEDLISCFLGNLYNYTLKKIGEARSYDIGESKIESILSVPASWDLEQREKMIEAANRAGMSCPILISEPEAAAIFCLHERLKDEKARQGATVPRLQTPEGTLTLDAGGGTADLITYIAEGTTLREGATGTGGTCGSEFLNSRFRKFFGPVLEYEIDETLRGMTKCHRDSAKRGIVDGAVNQFEDLKRDFTGQDGQDMIIQIPSSVEYKSKTGKFVKDIKIPGDYIKMIFERVLEKIIKLARQQIKAFNENNAADDIAISYILFVGGLSGNAYAREYLTAQFGPDRIKIKTPKEDSSTLISRGALLRSIHQDSIGEYYLRCSYGVARDEDYDSSVHKEKYNRKVHGLSKVYRDYYGAHDIVEKRIHWLFKAGCKVKTGQMESVRGWRGFPLYGKFDITETLYRSEWQTKDSLPVQDDRTGIHEVAVLRMTVDDVEACGYLATNPETGEEHRRIDYAILNTFHNPRSKFEMIIPNGGRFPDEVGWGRNYYKGECHIDVAAAVHGTPAPARARAKPRATSRQKVVAQPSRRSGRLTHSRLCLTAGGGQRLNEIGSSGLP